MRRTLIAAALLAAFAGTTTAAPAAKPQPTGTLSLAAASGLITYGNYAKLSGALSSQEAGISVTLQALSFPYTGKYADVATTATTTGGTYSFSALPADNTHYRAVAKTKPATTSAEVPVSVRWRVGLSVGDRTPRKGQRVRFSGRVKPVHPNAVVYVQRHTGAGWKTIRQTTLKTGTATSSGYRVRVKIRKSGRYRAAVLGDGAHETGVSRARRLKVH